MYILVNLGISENFGEIEYVRIWLPSWARWHRLMYVMCVFRSFVGLEPLWPVQ
jgi:hypothetical protein